MNKTFSAVWQYLQKRKDEDVIWYLIRIEKPILVQIFALIAFTAVFYIPYRSLQWSLLFIFSMYFHEFGHFLVFTVSKIKSTMLALFPLGAVAVPVTKSEDAKSDELPHYNIAWLTQAGIIGNVILLIIGRVFMHYGQGTNLYTVGDQLVYINTFLAFMNILPVWKLDAALFWKTLFSSASSSEEKPIVASTILLAIVGVVLFFLIPHSRWQALVLTIINNFGWWLLPLIVAAGVWHMQGLDDEQLSLSPKAMTNTQLTIQIVVYWLTVFCIIYFGLGEVKWFN